MASVTVVTLMNRHLTCKGSSFHLFEVLKSSHSTAHSICTDTLPGKCGNRNKSFAKNSSLYVKGEFRSIPFMDVLERPFVFVHGHRNVHSWIVLKLSIFIRVSVLQFYVEVGGHHASLRNWCTFFLMFVLSCLIGRPHSWVMQVLDSKAPCRKPLPNFVSSIYFPLQAFNRFKVKLLPSRALEWPRFAFCVQRSYYREHDQNAPPNPFPSIQSQLPATSQPSMSANLPGRLSKCCSDSQ